jgi:hypothetical protein
MDFESRRGGRIDEFAVDITFLDQERGILEL